jgi:hypothetical protein
MTGIFFFRRQYLRESLDILQGGGGSVQPTLTSNNWLVGMTDKIYLRICISAYLGDNIITKKHQKTKKESLDNCLKKTFQQVLMRICISVIF